METHRVHRLRFYNWEPAAITSIAYSKVNNLLAVQRSDNRIEIWNVKAVPFIQNTIFLKLQTKLRGLAWCNKRLFGADLEGFLKELDLVSLREKRSYPITSGGPCHCIAANRSNTLLAVGTELGVINIFQLEKQGLSYINIIPSEKKRILSICWDFSGDYLITGGVEVIKLFDYKNGNVIETMRPTKMNKRRTLIVWSVVVTDDLTIIAGDSRGCLSIWDGKKGICTDSIRSHPSDILTVCLSDDQKTVYCAGIDPDVKVYNRTRMKDGTTKWVKSREIVNHSHDVHGLIQINNEWLCSGGVDSYLSISKTSPFTVQLYPPLPQNPCVYVATQSRYVLLRYPTNLMLWHLKGISTDVIPSVPFDLLLDLRSVNDEFIRCAAISKDGNLIIYATNTNVRIFKFNYDEEILKFQPLSIPDCSIENVCNVSFTNDNKQLVISNSSSLIQVYSTSISEQSSEISLLYNISLGDDKKWSDNSICLLAISYSGDFFAVAGGSGEIAIWKKSKFHGRLPKHQLPATALTFHPRDNILYAVYSDFMFVEYSLDQMHYTQFSKSFNCSLLEKYLSKRNLPVTSISFDYDNYDVIILHTSSTICSFDKNKVVVVHHKNKKMKLDPEAEKSPAVKKIKQNMNNHQPGNFTLRSYFKKGGVCFFANDLSEDDGFHVYERYQHLVHFENFGSKEVVSVEIKPKDFLEKLPSLLKKTQFGRK